MRDYEKYIARQLKRGTSRQELNVSWLKKNELDLKRHVQDLRDNIRSNWTTTGQELSRELRQFWPASRPPSRPQSPARLAAFFAPNGNGHGHGHGDVPGSPLASHGPPGLAKSPSASGLSLVGVAGERAGGNTNDFITGYTLGLIGGVRSWVSFRPLDSRPPFLSLLLANQPRATQMTKSRRDNRDSSRPASDDDWEESSDDKAAEPGRAASTPVPAPAPAASVAVASSSSGQS